MEGVVPLSHTLDHIGPLTRTVTDAWHVYRALSGRQAGLPVVVPVRGLRLAVLRGYFCDLLDDGVRSAFEGTLEAIRAAGVAVDQVEIQNAGDIASIYLHIVLSEAAAYHAPTLERTPDRYTTPVRLRLELGRYILAEDYVRALAGRAVLERQVDAALSACDALVLPTLPIPAPLLGANTVRVGQKKCQPLFAEVPEYVGFPLAALQEVGELLEVLYPLSVRKTCMEDDHRQRCFRPVRAALFELKLLEELTLRQHVAGVRRAQGQALVNAGRARLIDDPRTAEPIGPRCIAE
jgi:Asp-tRNA(Asn)/Glu-tRNA(Gln) amidotransferase A subunit family amidase